MKIGTSASLLVLNSFITSTDVHYHRNPFGLEFYSANGIVEDDFGIFFAASTYYSVMSLVCYV